MKENGKDTNKEDMGKAKRMPKKVPKANQRADKGSKGTGKMAKAKAILKKKK